MIIYVDRINQFICAEMFGIMKGNSYNESVSYEWCVKIHGVSWYALKFLWCMLTLHNVRII